MSEWIELIEIHETLDRDMLKAKLESEGINIVLYNDTVERKFKLTEGIGNGVKLMVHRDHYEKAMTILKTTTYYIEPKNNSSDWVGILDKSTEGIPGLGKLHVFNRLIILVIFFTILIIAILTLTLANN